MKLSDKENRDLLRYNHVFPNNKEILQDYYDQIKAGIPSPKLNRDLIFDSLNVKEGLLGPYVEETGDEAIDKSNKESFERFNKMIRLSEPRYDVYQRKIPPNQSGMADFPDNFLGNLAYGMGTVEAGAYDALTNVIKGGTELLVGIPADVATGAIEDKTGLNVSTDVLGAIDENFPTLNTTGASEFIGVAGQYIGGWKIGEMLLKKSIGKKGRAYLEKRAKDHAENYPKISKISIPVFKYGAPAAIGEPIVATTGDRTLLQIAEKSGENIFGEKFFIPGVSDIPDFDDPNLTPKDRALKLLRQKSQFGAEAPLVVGGLSAGFEGLFKFATPYALKAGSIGKTYLGKGYDVAAKLITTEQRSKILGVPTGNYVGGSFVPSIIRGVNEGLSTVRKLPGLNRIPPVSEWKLYNSQVPVRIDGKINVDSGIQNAIGRIDAVLRAIRTNEALTPAAKERQRRAINQLEALKQSINRRFDVINNDISKIADSLTSGGKIVFRSGTNRTFEDGSMWAKTTFLDDFIKYLTDPNLKANQAFRLLDRSTRAQAAAIKRELLTLRRMFARAGLEKAGDDFIKGAGKDAYDYFTTTFRIVQQGEDFIADPKNYQNVVEMIKNLIRYQPKMLEHRKTLLQQNPKDDVSKLYEEHIEAIAVSKTRDLMKKGQGDGQSAKQLIEETENVLRDLVGKNYSKIFQSRKLIKENERIPEVINKLYGKVDDPKVIISNTLSELADAVVNTKMYDDLYNMGRNIWVFDSPDGLLKATANRIGGPNTTPLEQINLKGYNHTGIGNSLDGKWTVSAMKESIETNGGVLWTDRMLNVPFIKSYLAAKSLSQVEKTVFSPTTQIRNVTSAATFALAAGHVGNGASLKEAMYFIFKDVFTKNGIYDDAVIAKKMNEYLEEGVINSNMVIKEIEFLVKDSLRGNQKILNTDQLISHLYDTKAVSKLIDIYRAGDDLWKIYGYEYEKSLKTQAIKSLDDVVDYFRRVFNREFDADAYSKEVMSKFNPISKSHVISSEELLAPAIRQISSEVIKNVYPNYSYVPKLIQEMRRIPRGNFISFPAEMYRTQANLLRYGFKEMTSSNPLVRQQGARRIMGLSTALYLPFGAAELGKFMHQITNDQSDRFQRSFTPSWNQEGPIAFTGVERNDKGDVIVNYIPTSYQFPHVATTLAPFYKAMETISTLQEAGYTGDQAYFNGILQGIVTVARPFASESILTSAYNDVVVRGGKTAEGRPIYRRTDDFGDKVAKSAVHILKAVFTPGAVIQLDKFARASYNLFEKDRKDLIYTNQGEPFDFATEFLSLFAGVREYTVNVNKSFEKYELRDFVATLADNRSEATGKYYKMNMTAGQIYDAFVEQNIDEYRTFSKFYETVEDAKTWGLSDKELRKMFEGRQGLSKGDRRIIDKQFNPAGIPSFERRDRLNQIATDQGYENVTEFLDRGRFKEIQRLFRDIPLQLPEETVREIIQVGGYEKYLELQKEKDDPTIINIDPTREEYEQQSAVDIPITQPQATAATPQVAPPVATGTTQEVTPTETALLSPTELAIKQRSKRTT